jgi:hypothetical protein
LRYLMTGKNQRTVNERFARANDLAKVHTT